MKLKTLLYLQDRAHSIIDKARLKDDWSHNWLIVDVKDKSCLTNNYYKELQYEFILMLSPSKWVEFLQLCNLTNVNGERERGRTRSPCTRVSFQTGLRPKMCKLQLVSIDLKVCFHCKIKSFSRPEIPRAGGLGPSNLFTSYPLTRSTC